MVGQHEPPHDLYYFGKHTSNSSTTANYDALTFKVCTVLVRGLELYFSDVAHHGLFKLLGRVLSTVLNALNSANKGEGEMREGGTEVQEN